MHTIEIDFDVFKALTNRRSSESISYNDVIRDLLGMEPKENINENKNPLGGAPLIAMGVKFKHGTNFRVIYKGKTYNAKVIDGFLVYNEKRYSSPSMAGIAITGYNVNGWRFWEQYIPESNSWMKIERLRKN